MGKKKISKIMCLGLALLLFLLAWQESAAVPVLGAVSSVDGVIAKTNSVFAETKAYVLELDKDPGYDSQWFALGLARSGMDPGSVYFQTFYKNMAGYIVEKGGDLHRVKYTEYSKAILSLTAVGKDARNVNGYNLLEKLADFSMVTKQGLNGPIWALLALKSNPEYTIPTVAGVTQQTTERVLVDHLLSREIQGGGWSLTGDTADADITAMTIQALASYYRKGGYEAVTAAIDRGISRLSAMQVVSTDGFASMGANNLESCAQVLVALCSLGIDPQKDSRFIKQGCGIVGNLLSYHIAGSGFMHVKAGDQNNGGGEAGAVNGMATEQGLYALAAYKRFLEGKTSLYDMSDLSVKKGETVVPGANGQNQPPNGANNSQTGSSGNSGKTDGDKTNSGSSGNTNGNKTNSEKKDDDDSKKNQSSGSGNKSSGTTKKPSGKTKKPTGTVKTANVKTSSGNKATSGNKNISGNKTTSGGTDTGGDGNTQGSEASETSEITSASEIPESSEAIDDAETVEGSAGGWSFAGEEYVPDSSASSETEGSPDAAAAEQAEKSPSHWVLALGILGVALAGGGAVWYGGKRR